jgi:hypothetical protein
MIGGRTVITLVTGRRRWHQTLGLGGRVVTRLLDHGWLNVNADGSFMLGKCGAFPPEFVRLWQQSASSSTWFSWQYSLAEYFIERARRRAVYPYPHTSGRPSCRSHIHTTDREFDSPLVSCSPEMEF